MCGTVERGSDFAVNYTRIVEHEITECSFDARVLLVESLPSGKQVTIREISEQQRQGWQAVLNNFAKYVEAEKIG